MNTDNLLDRNRVLTREVMEREKNLFECLLVDQPFPADFWPHREDIKDLIFLNVAKSLIEHTFDCYWVRDLFDYYGITNYSTVPGLRKFMGNLDEMADSFRRMASVDELRGCFDDYIDWLLAGKPKNRSRSGPSE